MISPFHPAPPHTQTWTKSWKCNCVNRCASPGWRLSYLVVTLFTWVRVHVKWWWNSISEVFRYSAGGPQLTVVLFRDFQLYDGVKAMRIHRNRTWNFRLFRASDVQWHCGTPLDGTVSLLQKVLLLLRSSRGEPIPSCGRLAKPVDDMRVSSTCHAVQLHCRPCTPGFPQRRHSPSCRSLPSWVGSRAEGRGCSPGTRRPACPSPCSSLNGKYM